MATTANFSDINVPVTVTLDANGNGTATRETGFSVSHGNVAVESLTAAAIANDPAFVTEALAGNLYFNVHTKDFPGGATRGQLDDINDQRDANGVGSITLTATLDAAQEPSGTSTSDATGTATVTLTVDANGDVTYSSDLTLNGLTTSDLLPVAGLSAIHIHQGARGTNGPVILDVVQDAGGDTNGNALTPAANTGDGNVFDEILSTENLTDVNRVIGSPEGDTITSAGGNQTLQGGLGSDALNGGAGIDTADFSDIDVPVTVTLDANGNGTATRATGFSISYDDVAVQSLTTDAVADDAAFLAEALAGNLYFNIHTNDFGGGEIRGQLSTINDQRDANGIGTVVISGGLDAGQEPGGTSDSEATGTGTLTLNVDANGDITYSTDFSVTGLATSDLLPVAGLSAIHIHQGAAGVNGPVILDIVQDAGGDINGVAQTPAANTGDGNVFNEVTETDTLTSIENIIGSNDGDTINGGDGNNTLTGNDSADTLNGQGGDDVLDGGLGVDTLTGGAGADAFRFSDAPFDRQVVETPTRRVGVGDDFITDFDFARDRYQLNLASFDMAGAVLNFQSLDANAAGASISDNANVIVLQNANDNDPNTGFNAVAAADQIASLTDESRPGFFAYFNTALGVNRLVYSEDLSDANAGISILSRQTDLTGQDAIDALPNFTADNFEFENGNNGSTFVLPGNNLVQLDLAAGDNALQFTINSQNINEVSELQLFSTDAAGNIISNSPVSTLSLLADNNSLAGFSPQFTVDDFQDGEFFQALLVQNGNTRTATPTALNNGQVTLDFGDNISLNLAIGAFDVGVGTSALEVNAAGDELINLSGESDSLTMNFSVFREAAFDNTVGFYTTVDANGGVTDPVTGAILQPEDAGYQEAALANRVDVNITGENGQVVTGTATLDAGGFLGTYLIANGTEAAGNDVFFSYGAANGGNDHVRQLGNNTFGFEDLVGLGDADFNDTVVSFTLT
ncbi:beta strand repeat-containing protein [Leptothoe kymatousa]|uniref:CHRD domain-containing protein n=1 Tax=Leptothoe kymatousa TAU-MAC 1615 TaxID=2364775 RepID=A0ABS5XZX1_9CYAN|nr:CHRD domain-containing protein [Leptothoe kymatousa]MBT9311139.1 CHRD domain-containing protein [Leptothoe kymatousa TAU-MAC 1615]